MIDYGPTLVATLNNILPVHYEMTLTKGTKTPCISWMETNNYATDVGDTLGYSKIVYQIKVWGTDIGELNKYACRIDDALRPLGWTRMSSGELYDRNSTMIQKILQYEARAYETF
jgi:hypothetical protein